MEVWALSSAPTTDVVGPQEMPACKQSVVLLATDGPGTHKALIVAYDREIRRVIYLIPDPVASVEQALVLLDHLGAKRPACTGV